MYLDIFREFLTAIPDRLYYLGGFVSILAIIEKIRIERLKKSMHRVNVAVGAPFRPYLYRQIENDEKNKLRIPRSNLQARSIFIFTVLLLIIFITSVGVISDIDLFMTLLLSTVVGTVSLMAIYINSIRQQNKLYADLRSPVMKLTGPLSWQLYMTPKIRRRRDELYPATFYVGEYGFTVYHEIDPELHQKIRSSFEADDLVEVEFTPYSKTVLKLYHFDGID